MGRDLDLGAPPDPAVDEEAAWLDGSRAGDVDAYRKLVERYRNRIYTLALRVVRDPAEAEEVTQDAFVRAWRSLPGFRGEARFSTWLYRIAARRAFDRSAAMRARMRRELALGSTEAATALASSPGPSQPSEAALQLEKLIADLPELQRAVVTLFYYEDRSVADVALSLGLPEGTVKTHLHRARAALRRGWKQRHGGSSR